MASTRSSRSTLVTTARRKAAVKNCPDCSTLVLVGLDDDSCAFVASAELHPLRHAGELAAIYADTRRTYLLCAGELTVRYLEQYRSAADYPVLAEHRCADPIPATWLAPTSTSLRFPMEDTDEPPF